MKLLEKNFEPQKVENRIYKTWMDRKYFHAEVDENKEPFITYIRHKGLSGYF